ncbi:MAG TPA: hypothetical protein VLI06_00510 [Solimonas sp.]|nr:hypothetical protein [Solimonas sp.]
MSSASPSLLHLLRRPSGALLGLLLLAMLARGLVAPGFMPRFGAEGVSIVLCTPQGAKTLWQGEAAASAHADGSEHCAFGLALGAAALPPALPQLPARVLATAQSVSPALTAGRRLSGAHSARGPPRYS